MKIISDVNMMIFAIKSLQSVVLDIDYKIEEDYNTIKKDNYLYSKKEVEEIEDIKERCKSTILYYSLAFSNLEKIRTYYKNKRSK